MDAEQSERIDAFIAGGARPKRTSSEARIAWQGSRLQTLVDARGERTLVGAYYDAQSEEALSVGGFDTSQAPQRTGNTK